MHGFSKPLTELFDEDAVKCHIQTFWLNVIKCIITTYVLTSAEEKLVENHTREQSKSCV